MSVPSWTKNWEVDEVIECLPISDDDLRDLTRVAPAAYELDGVELSATWPKLTPATRRSITDAQKAAI